MPTVVFRGRYTDESVIRRELEKLFPATSVQMRFERSRYFCTIPQKLTLEQQQIILDAIAADHYTVGG